MNYGESKFGEDQTQIDAALVRSLIKVAAKAPIILIKVLKFLLEVECLEGI